MRRTPLTTLAALTVLLAGIASSATGCMTEKEYRKSQREQGAAPAAAPAEGGGDGEQAAAPVQDDRVKPLDGNEGMVEFWIDGFEEPDGGPRLVRQKLESIAGIQNAVYDPDTGIWRVRFARSRFNADTIAKAAVDAAWSELATKVTVKFIE